MSINSSPGSLREEVPSQELPPMSFADAAKARLDFIDNLPGQLDFDSFNPLKAGQELYDLTTELDYAWMCELARLRMGIEPTTLIALETHLPGVIKRREQAKNQIDLANNVDATRIEVKAAMDAKTAELQQANGHAGDSLSAEIQMLRLRESTLVDLQKQLMEKVEATQDANQPVKSNGSPSGISGARFIPVIPPSEAERDLTAATATPK